MKLISWNIWGMIFKNPYCYCNTIVCLEHLKDEVENNDDFVVVAVQESWIWKAGIFGWVGSKFLKKCNTNFASFLHVISLLFTYIFTLKNLNVAENLNTKDNTFIYQDKRVNRFNIMNSGLLMITNAKADDVGFIEFNDKTGLEYLSSKGFQYLYYENIDSLFINTHLQSENHNDIKEKQVKQIKVFIDKHKAKNKYIMGDFNLDLYNNSKQKIILESMHLKNINKNISTTNKGVVIDYCFSNDEYFDFKVIKGNISDHYLLKFEKNVSQSLL